MGNASVSDAIMQNVKSANIGSNTSRACVKSADMKFGNDQILGARRFDETSRWMTRLICFGIGVDLVNTRQQSRLSWFDWCALVAAFFSVTLGSLLAVWAVKVLFWASFQDASVVLKIFGALVCLALVRSEERRVGKECRSR